MNGRRFCFPFRSGSRFFGNGFGYFGGDYWDSEADLKSYKHDEVPYRHDSDPPPAPVADPASVSSPAESNSPPTGVVSREFAYGSIVSEVQNRLASEGFFRGSVDGYLTSGTRTAIAMFQDSHKLVITGRIDAALLQALGVKSKPEA